MLSKKTSNIGKGLTSPTEKIDVKTDAALKYHQDIGKAEPHCQKFTSSQVMDTTWMVKKGRKVTTAKPVGVSGVPSTICPVPRCSTVFSSMCPLTCHWADCHELYVWCYYCTLCKNWQKLAHKAVSHVRDHVRNKHPMGAPCLYLATLARPNGDFMDLQGMQPQWM